MTAPASFPASTSYGRLEAGTPGFKKATLALFLGGFSTFAMLYGTQPILPLFVELFTISPTQASLSVSAGTAGLAIMLIPASILSDRYGRGRVMKISLTLAAIIAFTCTLAADFTQLLILRGLLGAVLAGLPASALAYLGEEIAPNAQGRAVGLYIAGNALGGLSGRILASTVAESGSWRLSLTALAILGCIAAIAFWRNLPASRHFHIRTVTFRRILDDTRIIYSDTGLRWLFLAGFLLMGAFVGLYNYLGFHLLAPPFNLSQTGIGAIFFLYLIGTWASAWAGRLTDRLGRANVLWAMVSIMFLGLTLALGKQLWIVILAVALFTFGFFGAHTTASGWVSHRAGEQRALGAALYLCSYYFGGSVLGSIAGMAWDSHGWPSVVGILMLLTLIALAVSLYLRHRLRISSAAPPRH